MTAEERFERIEADLAVVAATQKGVAEAQRLHQETLGQLMQAIAAFVDSAEARMKRTEQNLDTLIRAITADHSNGKG